MNFGAPQWLPYLWAIPFLGAFAGLAWWRNRKQRVALADLGLLEHVVVGASNTLDFLKAGLMVLTCAFILLALARPQWGEKLVPAKTKGADIILVVDASLSMLSQDVPPDRLGLARRDLHKLLDSIGAARVGLVAFAGRGFRQIPLTQDMGAVITLLDALGPDQLPYAGTDLAKALEAAGVSLRSSTAARKLVILVSDGGDHGKGASDAAKALHQAGAELIVAGVGGEQAVPIPLPEGGNKQDKEGNVVTTRLERQALQDLAKAGEGLYIELAAIQWNLAPVLQMVQQAQGAKAGNGMEIEHIERFPWFAGAALLLLITHLLLPAGRPRRMA